MTPKDVVAGVDASAARTAMDLRMAQAPEASPIPRRITTPRQRQWWAPGSSRSFRGWTRGLACLAAVVSMLASGVVSPAPAGASIRRGYTLSANIIGEAPNGFKVYVEPTGSHHRSLGNYSYSISNQLRGYGLPVRFGGYANPAKTRGIITVTEGSSGCSGSSTTLANTYWYYSSVPGGGFYMYRSDIVVCPSRYGRLSYTQRIAMLRHEFGHTMGLGHTNYTYNGSLQIMNAYLHSGVSNYKSGDVAGLKRMASGTAIVRRALS